MDRWFLTQKDVVSASRKFVCVRMMTYENAAEEKVLKSLWRPGAPLENTLFAILDPSGRPVTTPSRSPDWMFRSAYEMASGMNEIAASYQPRNSSQGLPVLNNVRLAMNVAACDKRPLAVVVGYSPQERKNMENVLAAQSWNSEFVGKVAYASGTQQDLAFIQGVRVSQGFVFILPNEFGSSGTVIQQLPIGTTSEQLAAALRLTIERYQPIYLDHREHIRLGHQQGILWRSALPITDPHEVARAHHGPPDHQGFGGPPPPFGPPPEE